MPFLDHLEELRWRILRSLAALMVGAILGWVIVQRFGVLDLLIRPGESILQGRELAYFGPAKPFFVTLKLALVVGALLAFPWIVREVWGFLSPGLKKEEKKVIVPSLYFGLILFCAGAAMAYWWVLPLAFRFLSSFQAESLTPVIEVGEYLTFVTMMLIAFGTAFELPIVVMILSVLGLVTPDFMRRYRRHAIVAITILSSMMTPGDLVSTFMMIAPLMILYEVSILLSAMIQRKRREESILAPAEGPPPGSEGGGGP